MNRNITPAKKPRQSGVELLRIISMFLVLLIHTNMWNEKWHGLDLQNSFSTSATTIFLQSISCVCVNVFVLISGWFGIRFSVKRLTKFIFQCMFFFTGIYVVFLALGLRGLTVRGIMDCFLFNDINWFIRAYILLFIISPILNAFVEKTNKREMETVLVSFFAFQTIYGWATPAAHFIQWGLSVTSFVGLYLLAQYVRKYQYELIIVKGGGKISVAYFSSTLLLFLVTMVSVYLKFDYLTGKIFAYTSPIVILNSLLLLLTFVNIDRKGFVNPVINKIAASSFAAYLLHHNPNVMDSFWKNFCWNLYENHWATYIPLAMLFLISVFSAAVIIDQVRIFCWNKIETLLNKYANL